MQRKKPETKRQEKTETKMWVGDKEEIEMWRETQKKGERERYTNRAIQRLNRGGETWRQRYQEPDREKVENVGRDRNRDKGMS